MRAKVSLDFKDTYDSSSIMVMQSFAFHYSTDGERYDMMRFFHLPADKTIKVGLLAQAPTGSGEIRVYENVTIEKRTVKNVRMGE